MTIPSDATPESKESKRFDTALQTRQFEIDLVWKRALFFWGLIASAFVAIGALKRDQPGLSLLVASFGLVCSIAWTLANRGSKYWQEQWESKLESAEKEVIGQFFQTREPRQRKGFWGGYPYSVSRLAILVSDFVCLIWVLVFIRQSLICFGFTPSQFDRIRPCADLAVIAGTVVSVLIVLYQGRSTPVEGGSNERGTPTVGNSNP